MFARGLGSEEGITHLLQPCWEFLCSSSHCGHQHRLPSSCKPRPSSPGPPSSSHPRGFVPQAGDGEAGAAQGRAELGAGEQLTGAAC